MPVLSYELVLLDNKSEIDKESLKKFVNNILKTFNGICLLSNISVKVIGKNLFLIYCNEEAERIVQGGLCLFGKYKNIPCTFKLVNIS